MRKALVSLAIAACVVPAIAFAADPKPKSSFVYCKSSSSCPLSFRTNNDGSKITKLTMYDKCSEVPVGSKGFFPPVRVNDEGKFAKEGSVDNVIGEKIAYEIHGRFKKPGKAVGEYKLTSKGCSDSAHDFVAKRTEQ